MTADTSLPWVAGETSHVKAWQTTLHQKEFVTYLVSNTGLSSLRNFHEPAANVCHIVHRDGARQKLAVTGVHCASHNTEVNYLSEEVIFQSKTLHGSCQMVVQTGHVLIAFVFQVNHHEASHNMQVTCLSEEIIVSCKSHHGSCQIMVQIGYDLVAWVVFWLQGKYLEAAVILSQTGHCDKRQRLAENEVDQRVVVVCHQMVE